MSPLTEVLAVFAAVSVITAILGALQDVAYVGDFTHLAIAAMFLGVALRLARRESNGARRFGIDLEGWLDPPENDDASGLVELVRTARRSLPSAVREFGFAVAVGSIVFPPFVVGFWIFNAPTHPFVWRLPPDFVSFVLTQFVLAALPEEAFFRGYVQTRLEDAWPNKVRFLGATLNPWALLVQAALFALVHLATEPSIEKLAVFFPGLLFGVIRARRSGIGASLTFHALSNVLAEILVNGWLRAEL